MVRKVLLLAVMCAALISYSHANDFRADEAQVRDVLSEFVSAYRSRDIDHLSTLAYPSSPIIFSRVEAGIDFPADLALFGLSEPLEYKKRHLQKEPRKTVFRDIRQLSIEDFQEIFSRFPYCFLKLSDEDIIFTSESSCWVRAKVFCHLLDPSSDNYNIRVEHYIFAFRKFEDLWLLYGLGTDVVESEDDPYYLVIRGDKKLLEGDIDGAVSDFKKAIEIDPALSVAYFELGLAYVKDSVWMESHPEATKYLSSMQKATVLEPDIPLYHDFLAFAYQAKGELKNAGFERTRVLQLDSRYPLAD